MATKKSIDYAVLKKNLEDSIFKLGEDVKNDFPQRLRRCIEYKIWEHYQKEDGSAFKNFGEWVCYMFPRGCQMPFSDDSHALTYENALELTKDKQFKDVHRMLLDNAPPKQKRGRQGGTKIENGKAVNATYAAFKRGGKGCMDKSVLKVRLKEEKPEFYDKLENGQFRSVRAAAEAAGIVKPANKPLARLKSFWKRASDEERAEFRKWLRTKEAQ